MEEKELFSKGGEFKISSKPIVGNLTIDGARSNLELHSQEPFNVSKLNDRHITGVLNDCRKASLINCITSSSGEATRSSERYYHSNVFPHYVVLGDDYIDPLKTPILSTHFTIEDNAVLFNDPDAFGHVINNEDDIKGFLKQVSDKSSRKFEIGKYPEVFYYTGKNNIFNAKTHIGEIYAAHGFSFTMPSTRGIHVDNSVSIYLDFTEPVLFEEAIHRFSIVLGFVDIILGRPQKVEKLLIQTEAQEGCPSNFLNVYNSMEVNYNDQLRSGAPHFTDILIGGARDSDNFSCVLSSWIERHEPWSNARFSFLQSFRKDNQYTVDRLIAAANLFDIVPEDEFTDLENLSNEMCSAVSECKKIFKKIEQCSERDQILGALGRVGKHNLKSKIKNRTKIINQYLRQHLQDMDMIIDEAVNCRNYFVHGTSQGKIAPKYYYALLCEFTDTLEFIFAVSDLIQSGWNIQKWHIRGSCLSHPFSRYLYNYPKLLKKFNESVAADD